MSRLLTAALLSVAAPCLAQDLDREALFRHVRRAFSLPADVDLALKDLKPSALEGWSAGTLELADGKQKQTIHVSKDGRYYVLSEAFRLTAAPGPAGLRGPAASDAPPVQVSPDGRWFLMGEPKDLRQDPDAANRGKIRLAPEPSWGPANAPVVLVEYSDLQCPHCKSAHEILEKELPSYKDKVRWETKHYPLVNIHPWAYEAALADACAAMQSRRKAHALRSAVFREQGTIQKETLKDRVLALAKAAGLDAARLGRCLSAQESKAAVDADIAEADALGVRGTPTIFVNGRQTRGYSPESVKSVIDEMLSAR